MAGGQHQLMLNGGGRNHHVEGAADDALYLKLPAQHATTLRNGIVTAPTSYLKLSATPATGSSPHSS